MRRASVVRLSIVLGFALVVWLAAPLVWLVFDEVGIPSNHAARAVPAGVEVVSSDEQCASGGCWRELTLRWPAHAADELRTRLGLPADGTGERCRRASLLDRRRACVGVDDVLAAQPGAPDLLRIEVWWSRPGWR